MRYYILKDIPGFNIKSGSTINSDEFSQLNFDWLKSRDYIQPVREFKIGQMVTPADAMMTFVEMDEIYRVVDVSDYEMRIEGLTGIAYSLNYNQMQRFAPSTRKQMSDVLFKEAEKHGFVNGVRYTSIPFAFSIATAVVDELHLGIDKDTKWPYVYSGGGTIYHNGEWAKIGANAPYKVNDWVWWTGGQVRKIKSIDPFIWWDDLDNGYNLTKHPDEYRLATSEEIEKHLLYQAERRGFKQGTIYTNVSGMRQKAEYDPKLYYTEYKGNCDLICGYGQGLIYDDETTIWAQVYAPFDRILGYKIDRSENLVSIGCKNITKENLEILKNVCKDFKVSKLITGFGEVDIKEINEI